MLLLLASKQMRSYLRSSESINYKTDEQRRKKRGDRFDNLAVINVDFDQSALEVGIISQFSKLKTFLWEVAERVFR